MRWIMAILAIATLTDPAAAQVRRFNFEGAKADGATPVAAGRAYDGDFGFEARAPGLFSVRAAPGNYRVTVTLGLPRVATDTTVKAEARRLMLDAVKVPAGRSVTRSFIVNIRDAAIAPPAANAPGASLVELKPRERDSFTWDDRLTLEFVGPRPGVTAVAIEPVTVPTVFLLGDSTVTDQQAEPAASWGQMLTAFMKDDVAVANHAESGETMKSFIAEKRFAKVLESVKPGDVALIQFGHNDQKANWPQTYVAADSTYRSYLRVFIDEFRRRGVTPILVTSPERRNWTAEGRIRPTLADYAAAVRAVGTETGVPVIDLNAATIRIYEALGKDRAPLAFNDGGKDATHHNNYGAWVLARAIAQGIADARLPLAAHLKSDLGRFDPASPPDPARFILAPSGISSERRPDGN
ncbi:rhamnogalacturonan acetylesterase [Sphingomonas sp. RS2018]